MNEEEPLSSWVVRPGAEEDNVNKFLTKIMDKWAIDVGRPKYVAVVHLRGGSVRLNLTYMDLDCECQLV